MIDAVERITNALLGPGPADPEVQKTALARSMILSVDMAHAVHPNYASKVSVVHLCWSRVSADRRLVRFGARVPLQTQIPAAREGPRPRHERGYGHQNEHEPALRYQVSVGRVRYHLTLTALVALISTKSHTLVASLVSWCASSAAAVEPRCKSLLFATTALAAAPSVRFSPRMYDKEETIENFNKSLIEYFS